MPIWTDPPRRLLNAIRRLRGERSEQITFETIEAVQDRDGYLVKGTVIPASGTAQLRAGERHPVLSKAGVPRVVLAHTARRAQFPRTPGLPAALGIVEELAIGTETATGVIDVYFRNYGQLTPLKIRDFIGPDGELTGVFWGVNEDVFGVRVDEDVFHVLRLERNDPAKIFATSETAAIREHLYTVDLSSITVPLTTITVNFTRDSIEPNVNLVWFQNAGCGLDPLCPFLFISAMLTRTDNVNTAAVSRTVTLKLSGAATVTYEGPIAPGEIVVNAASAELASVLLDANNDLIYSAKVLFDAFGVKQGNSTTGLTGQHKILGEGDLVNAGIGFVSGCPHVLDDVGVMGFNGNGNPGGVLATRTTETHAVMINARTGAVVFTTFNAAPTLAVTEETDGLTPNRIVQFTNMPVVTPQCVAPPGWRTACTSPFVTTNTVDVGNLGDIGVATSQRSLFSPSIVFAPDAVQREVAIRLNVPAFGIDQEWTDGFQIPPLSFNVPTCARIDWSSDSVDVFDRYTVDVVMTPFYAAGGALYTFVSVLRHARRPFGFASDPHQIGVFVLQGATLRTIQNYTTVDTPVLPVFLSGNSTRVLWSHGSNWYLSDYIRGISALVGTNAAADVVQGLVLTNPDFLYDTLEDDRFFIEGWDPETFAITLSQAAPTFPPKDLRLKTVGGLRDIPGSKTLQIKPTGKASYQTINDPRILGPLGL